MKKLLMIIGLGLMLTGTAFAQAKIPDIHIEMSFRQMEDGKLSAGVHLFELWCDNGRCDLTVTSLNQCFLGGFVPKVARASNMLLAGLGKGTLKVKYSGKGMLQLDEDIVGGKISYFLSFREAKTESEERQTHNKLFINDEKGPKKIVLTDFKGSVTKYSTVLDKVISAEYVPLVDEIYTLVKLDCDASVPGTISLKKNK
jgi:hypothetical protein